MIGMKSDVFIPIVFQIKGLQGLQGLQLLPVWQVSAHCGVLRMWSLCSCLVPRAVSRSVPRQGQLICLWPVRKRWQCGQTLHELWSYDLQTFQLPSMRLHR